MADETPYVPFQSMTRRPDIQFATSGVPMPGVVYVTRDDGLFIQSKASGALSIAQMDYRILQPDGQIVAGRELITNTGDRTTQSNFFKLPEGYLLGVSFSGFFDLFVNGSVHLRVFLGRGQGNNQTRGRLLAAGYVSGTDSLGWPDNTGAPTKQCFGNIQKITIAAPGAGNEVVGSVPTQALWRIMAARFTLVTSAVVANRLFNLQFSNVTPFFSVESTGVQTASQTRNYNAGIGVTRAAAVTDDVSISIPDMWLPPGTSFTTTTDTKDVGDAYGATQLLIEEHLAP
jgi:hypothetical protein